MVGIDTWLYIAQMYETSNQESGADEWGKGHGDLAGHRESAQPILRPPPRYHVPIFKPSA
jgi:hypothetical protein